MSAGMHLMEVLNFSLNVIMEVKMSTARTQCASTGLADRIYIRSGRGHPHGQDRETYFSVTRAWLNIMAYLHSNSQNFVVEANASKTVDHKTAQAKDKSFSQKCGKSNCGQESALDDCVSQKMQLLKVCDERVKQVLNRRIRRATERVRRTFAKRRTDYYNIARAEKMVARCFDDETKSSNGKMSKPAIRAEGGLLSTMAAIPTEARETIKSYRTLSEEAISLLSSLRSRTQDAAVTTVSNMACSFITYRNSAMSAAAFYSVELIRMIINNLPCVSDFIYARFSDLLSFVSQFITLRQGQVRDDGGPQEGLRAEAGDPEKKTKSAISAVGDAITWILTGNDASDDKVFKSKMNHYGNLFKNITFITTGVEKMSKITSWFFNDFAPSLFTRVCAAWTLKSVSVPVQDKTVELSTFVSEVMDLCVYDLARFKEQSYIERLHVVYQQASWLASSIAARKMTLTSLQTSTVNSAIATVMKFYSNNQVFIKYPALQYRPTPFPIQLVGPPNAGKSTVANALARRIMSKQMCVKEYPENSVYCLSQCKHWDGFTNQMCIIIDDLCQQKGAPGAEESDAMQYIRLISNVAFITPQASLEAKGMPCISDLVISTTNSAFPDIKELRDADAYYRRRHLVYQIRVKDIFKNDFAEAGINDMDEFNSYVFFLIKNPLSASELTSLTNELASNPMTPQNMLTYRVKYGALCWPEFVKVMSKMFNDHLAQPDPAFATRCVNEDEYSVYKRDIVIRSQRTSTVVQQPPRLDVGATGVGATEGQGALLSRVEDDTQSIWKSTRECDGITYCCYDPREFWNHNWERNTSPFVRYCHANQCAYYYGRAADDRLRLYYVDTRGHMSNEMRRHVTELQDAIPDVDPNREWRDIEPHQRNEVFNCGWCDTCTRKLTLGDQFMDTHEVEDAVYNPFVEPVRLYVEPLQEIAPDPQNMVDGEESGDDEAQDPDANWDDWDEGANQAQAGLTDSLVAWAETTAKYLKLSVEELVDLVKSMPTYIWVIIGSCLALGAAAAAHQLFRTFFSDDECEEPKAARCKLVVEIPEYLSEDVLEYTDAIKAEAKLVEAITVNASNKKKSYREVSDLVETTLQAEAGHAYDANLRTKPSSGTRLRPQTVNKIVAQAYVGPTNAKEVGLKIATRNILSVYVKMDAHNDMAFRVLATGGRTVIFPGHTMRVISQLEHPEITMWRDGVEFKNVDLDLDKAVAIDNYDLYFVQLPKKMPMMSPIEDHIQDLADECTSSDRYIYFAYDAKKKDMIIERTPGVACYEENYVFDMGQYTMDCRILNGYRTPIFYGVGYCGSILMNESTGKICGMHVAGNPNSHQTYFTPLTKDLFKFVVGAEPIVDATEAQAALIATQGGSRIMEQTGVVELIGVVGPDYHQQPPNVNKWKETKLGGHEHPMFPIRKEPSVMSLRDQRVSEEVRRAGRTPLQLGLDKSSLQPVEFKPRTVAMAVKVVNAALKRMPKGNIGKRLLTWEEQINGVMGPNGRVYDGMDMKTASGLPLRPRAAKTGLAGKLPYFEEMDHVGPNGEKLYKLRPRYNRVETGSYLVDIYQSADSLLRQGRLPFYVNAMNLKMETLKLSKIESAGTRSFECLPIHMTMLVRKYFGAFFEALQVNCDMYPVSVGIAAQKGSWTRLAQRLKRWGGKVIAGDYKQWDGKLMPCIMRAAIDVVNEWYEDEPDSPEALARMCLAETHSHGYVAAVNMLFRRHGGMPSGSPMTSPINSICNWLNILCATIEIIESKGHSVSIEKLITDVELAVYGDDHVVAFGPEFLGKVTFKDFHKIFNELGLGYTDSTKSTNIDFEYEQLEDTTYLKRKFVPYKGYFLAPLDIVSIENMPLWWEARNRCREIDVIKEKKISFVEELAMHTREVYDEHVQKWNDHIQKLKDQGSLVCEEGQYPFIYDEHEYKQGEILKGIVDSI